jgi:hypothetical protein
VCKLGKFNIKKEKTMSKWIALLMTLCSSYSVASNDTVFQFLAGYRHDSVNWDVQVPKCDPVFKTSSHFENIEIFQVGVRGRSNLGCNFYTRGNFNLGWVLDGDHKDKTRLFSEASNNAFNIVSIDQSVSFSDKNVLDGRFVLDLDLAFGYPFYFCNCQAYIAPVIGYAFNEQYLTDDENTGFYAIADSDCDTNFCGGRDCCTSKFISKWYGPFIGLDFNYDTGCCLSFYGALEYHWVGQKTKRHGATSFGLFDNWDHHNNGARGFVCNLGLDYDWSQCWSVGLDFVYRDFSANRHKSRDCNDINLVLGNEEDCGNSLKSSTKWRSYAISVFMARQF